MRTRQHQQGASATKNRNILDTVRDKNLKKITNSPILCKPSAAPVTKKSTTAATAQRQLDFDYGNLENMSLSINDEKSFVDIQALCPELGAPKKSDADAAKKRFGAFSPRKSPNNKSLRNSPNKRSPRKSPSKRLPLSKSPPIPLLSPKRITKLSKQTTGGSTDATEARASASSTASEHVEPFLKMRKAFERTISDINKINQHKSVNPQRTVKELGKDQQLESESKPKDSRTTPSEPNQLIGVSKKVNLEGHGLNTQATASDLSERPPKAQSSETRLADQASSTATGTSQSNSVEKSSSNNEKERGSRFDFFKMPAVVEINQELSSKPPKKYLVLSRIPSTKRTAPNLSGIQITPEYLESTLLAMSAENASLGESAASSRSKKKPLILCTVNKCSGPRVDFLRMTLNGGVE
jgi:hypothetical protein